MIGEFNVYSKEERHMAKKIITLFTLFHYHIHRLYNPMYDFVMDFTRFLCEERFFEIFTRYSYIFHQERIKGTEKASPIHTLFHR